MEESLGEAWGFSEKRLDVPPEGLVLASVAAQWPVLVALPCVLPEATEGHAHGLCLPGISMHSCWASQPDTR